MQAVIRSFVSGGNVVRSSLLQHLRVINPAIQPSVLLSSRSESTQPARMEEHGFESTTISDVMNAKGKSADGSWLWCTTDDTVYDAVKSVCKSISLCLPFGFFHISLGVVRCVFWFGLVR